MKRRKRRTIRKIECILDRKITESEFDTINLLIKSIVPSLLLYTTGCPKCNSRDGFSIKSASSHSDSISACAECGIIRNLGNIDAKSLYPELSRGGV